MNILLRLHELFQKGVEKLFFHGRTTVLSRRLAYRIENLVLMLVIFYIILNTLLYDWTGALYAEGTGFRLDWVFGGLDSLIPFVPEMAIFYVYLFYSTTILSMLYFAFIDPKKGHALSWMLVIINAVAIIVYIFFPVSTFWYRAELLARPLTDNLWAKVMYQYFAGDTSFNCFPSLHAAVATATAYVWYRYARIKKSVPWTIIAIVMAAIGLGVVLSTLFVKQHYIADEIAGIALALLVGKIVIDGLWKKPVQACLGIQA